MQRVERGRGFGRFAGRPPSARRVVPRPRCRPARQGGRCRARAAARAAACGIRRGRQASRASGCRRARTSHGRYRAWLRSTSTRLSSAALRSTSSSWRNSADGRLMKAASALITSEVRSPLSGSVGDGGVECAEQRRNAISSRSPSLPSAQRNPAASRRASTSTPARDPSGLAPLASGQRITTGRMRSTNSRTAVARTSPPPASVVKVLYWSLSLPLTGGSRCGAPLRSWFPMVSRSAARCGVAAGQAAPVHFRR